MYLISFSTIVASLNRGESINSYSTIIGLTIWLGGFFIESIADKQLSQFVRDTNNKGHVLQSGLWKYSRHPNYFGEVTQWWGLFAVVALMPYGLLALVSPITITCLILFVSGVPLLEQKYAGRPEFESYKKRTSVFIPWFPGK